MRISIVNIILQFLMSSVFSKISKKTLVITLSIVVVIAGLYSYYIVAKQMAYNAGYKAASVSYEIKLNQVYEDYNKLVKAKQKQADELTASLAKLTIQSQKDYEKGYQDAENQAHRIISDHIARINRLSIEISELKSRPNSTHSPSSRNSVSVTRTERRATLSKRSAEFLVGQATKADQVLEQLNMCKTVLRKTHETVVQHFKNIDAFDN